ncbi:conjugal transfer protein TraG N-terminal domain-containing protein [Photorhabdus antumapuensis]|uniref:conjugal transfer protein TraG N-terminal domain-containing protein n=1 Tax=Photorhabdus antumapuensis TaxID=2862867 RepID=UPI001CEDED76|nr:conjugal transfer protein TraG N-terminal domain-containing protein [Photorhabdus antumapuensis]MCA6220300.1 conjugal transfer protein TraG N-terminal domain-containing protein [Photorhabdus antumapuensis]
MTTYSYLEYFLTLLGWMVNNGLWNVLLATGLFVLPLTFKIIGIWLKVREEGEDEGNKGMLSVTRIENTLYGAFLVMIACCVPLVNVSLSTITYDDSRAKSCGTWTPKPAETGYASVISSLEGKTAAAPVWWILVHQISKGVTQAAIASLPCRPDLRQLRFEVQHTQINNPALAQILQDFTHDCYALALYQWKRRDEGKTLDEAVLRDIEWLGSKTFLNGAGYYDALQSKTPRSDFPWKPHRDDGFANTGQGGYPTCKEWWSDSQVGLEKRIMAQVEPGMWFRLSAALKLMGKETSEYKEAVIRRLVSPENLTTSQGGHVYAGYGGNADFTLMNSVGRLASLGGMSLGSLAAFPAFDAMRQALPMVQAVILMAVTIILPLIIVFAVYEYKTVITLTFVVFALNFLTFWWELARWLDSWLLEALYGSDTHSRWNMAGFQNSTDDIIMSFVMGAMFIVLPALWMGALSWAGIRVGGALENTALRHGTSEAQSSGAKIGESVSNKIMK